MAESQDQTLVTIVLAADEDAPDEHNSGPGLFGLEETQVERVVRLALERTGITQPVELNIVVTDDDELQRLNRDYRGRDEVTDVLSFPLLDAPLVRAPAEQLWHAADDMLDAPEDAASAGGRASSPSANANATSFAFRVPPDALAHLGDIVIARGATARQATQAGHTASWELAYLVAHGVLHLIGYDDHTEAGYAAMVAHQEAVLQQAAIAR